MAKKSEDQRQKILDAALLLFAREGFHKASIRRIAEAAGLNSPPLIYWYFKDKNELFQAVMLERIAPIHVLEALPAMQGEPPEVVLWRLGVGFLEGFNAPDSRKLFRVYLGEAARKPETTEYLARSGMLRAKSFLVDYFRHQIKLGRLKPHDPEISARAFMGSLLHYVLGRELFPPLREGLPPLENYVTQTVRTFIEGLKKE